MRDYRYVPGLLQDYEVCSEANPSQPEELMSLTYFVQRNRAAYASQNQMNQQNVMMYLSPSKILGADGETLNSIEKDHLPMGMGRLRAAARPFANTVRLTTDPIQGNRRFSSTTPS